MVLREGRVEPVGLRLLLPLLYYRYDGFALLHLEQGAVYDRLATAGRSEWCEIATELNLSHCLLTN